MKKNLQTTITTAKNLKKKTTERKKAEETLKKAKAFTESALNSITDIFYSFDLSGKFLSWNKTLNRISGYSDQELSLKKPKDFFLGEDIQRIAESVERIYKEGASKIEANFVLKDGRQIPCEFTGSILKDGKGNIIGFSGTGRDITERKKAEEKLKISEENYRELFQNAEMGMYRTKIDGSGYLDFNNKFAEIFGFTREELLGTQPMIRWADPADRDQMLRLLKENGVVNNYESRVLTQSGEVKTVLASFKLYPDKGYIEGSIADITERKKAEEELHRRRQELFHMQRFKSMGELASSLAHEINQPLAGILSNAQATQRFLAGTKPDLSQIREILADIVADDKRAGEVIHRLRALLRKDEAPRESMDINSAIQNVMTLVHDEATVRNVTLLSELAEGLPQVYADKIQIEQVILNLVMNAAQAMEDIAAHKRNIVISTARDTPNGVVVSVRDTGLCTKSEA